MGTLTGLTIERIMENGRIMAFTDTPRVLVTEIDSEAPYLTYFDFICKVYTYIRYVTVHEANFILF